MSTHRPSTHRPSTRRAPRRDRGSVLPLVLVLVVTLGAVVVAMARYATANLRYSQVAEAHASRLSAADAALRNATDQLRAGAAECLFTGQPVVLPSATTDFAGVAASVECDSLSGSIDAATTWAVVITGQGVPSIQSLLPTDAGSNNKVIDGRVWMSRIDTSALQDIGPAHKVEIRNGPLVYYDPAANCTPVSAASIFTRVIFQPSLIYRPICVPTPWINQPSFDDPPISNDIVTMLGNGAFLNPAPNTTDPNCTVYSPGIYTTMPNITDDSYFRTGDYYFAPPVGASAAASVISIQGDDVRAGSIDPSLAITPEISMASSPCADEIAADAGGVGGRYGATFYLGSTARINVDANASLEIMPRLQSGTDRTATASGVTRRDYVSVQAICNPSSGVGLPDGDGDSWCDRTDQNGAAVVGLSPSTLAATVGTETGTTNRSIVYTAAGANKELVTHGRIYTPLQQVRFANAASPTTDVRVLGGVIVARLDIQVVPSATNFRIGVQTSPGTAEVVLTSTATKNGLTTSMEAVVGYRPTASVDDRIDIRSWRVCDTAGC